MADHGMAAAKRTGRRRVAWAPSLVGWEGIRDRTARLVVWLAALVYVVVLSLESVSAHRSFVTGYDTALYDQLLKAVIDLQVLLNDIRANPKRYRPEVNIDIF